MNFLPDPKFNIICAVLFVLSLYFLPRSLKNALKGIGQKFKRGHYYVKGTISNNLAIFILSVLILLLSTSGFLVSWGLKDFRRIEQNSYIGEIRVDKSQNGGYIFSMKTGKQNFVIGLPSNSFEIQRGYVDWVNWLTTVGLHDVHRVFSLHSPQTREKTDKKTLPAVYKTMKKLDDYIPLYRCPDPVFFNGTLKKGDYRIKIHKRGYSFDKKTVYKKPVGNSREI